MRELHVMAFLCVASLLPLSGATCSNGDLNDVLGGDARLRLFDNDVDLDEIFNLDDLFRDRSNLNLDDIFRDRERDRRDNNDR
jgi:hypothetical protein